MFVFFNFDSYKYKLMKIINEKKIRILHRSKLKKEYKFT